MLVVSLVPMSNTPYLRKTFVNCEKNLFIKNNNLAASNQMYLKYVPVF